MHEPLLHHIRDLERANRRWKALAAGLMLALVLTLAGGLVASALLGLRVTAFHQREQEVKAMEDELQARDAVLEQRLAAERQRRERPQEEAHSKREAK